MRRPHEMVPLACFALLLLTSRCSTERAGAVLPTAGTAGANAAGSAGDHTTIAVADVPCDVAAIISDHCTLCHASKPRNDAPMSLVTLADFQAPAKSDPSRTVALAAQFRILPSDESKIMPPSNSTSPLSMSEKILLIHWLSSFTSSTVVACPITEPDN